MNLVTIKFLPLNLSTFILAVFFLLLASVVAVAVYRLYLSPLANFPGPRLAALTSAYEGYFDCFKDGGGRYFVEINRMHDIYGKLPRDISYNSLKASVTFLASLRLFASISL